MKTTLLLIFLLLSFCVSVNAQSEALEPFVVKSDAGACESNAASLDNLVSGLRSSDERLFVVARLGAGERSRDLIRRRLYNVRAYFEWSWPELDAKRFVFSEGDRVAGEGRVEFYVGSRLLLISLVERGRDICVACCDSPDLRYYGSGKRDKPKTRR